MFSPENYIAIVKSPHEESVTTILLEPTEPGGLEIAKKYKKELYSMGIPVITFSSDNIFKTVDELKGKGVKFNSEVNKTDYGYDVVFNDNNGNFIQLIQMN